MRIDDIQYRLVISELIASFFFLRSCLERSTEEAEMYKPTTIVSIEQKEGKNKKSKNARYNGISVKYPLWNTPWHPPPSSSIRSTSAKVSFPPLGPPLIPFLALWPSHMLMVFCCTCTMFTKLLSARSIILITTNKEGEKEGLRERDRQRAEDRSYEMKQR